jgi:hypothetical protein
MFPVEHSVPNNRDCCQGQIIEVQEDNIVNLSACKVTEPPIDKHWDHQNDILVEHVHDEVTVAAISFSSVAEEQVLQHFKLADRVVGSTGRLLTLKATNADSYMCCGNHTDIVGTISDRQS